MQGGAQHVTIVHQLASKTPPDRDGSAAEHPVCAFPPGLAAAAGGRGGEAAGRERQVLHRLARHLHSPTGCQVGLRRGPRNIQIAERLAQIIVGGWSTGLMVNTAPWMTRNRWQS